MKVKIRKKRKTRREINEQAKKNERRKEKVEDEKKER